ncbi:MAG TPA: MarR family winged helix-turn-helix transcriptional regulator [Gemmatimonadaceae bacterium]|nr:MarR family winged helix-turn-helix transcriptional regulator [Gemmatimonadaceae bacterium]
MKQLETRFSKAEDSPGFMLWKAANLMQRLHAGCLKDLDITPTQFSLMTCLVYLQGDGDVTASRIVAHTGMDKMMVSDLLKTLERKELLTKSANPADARSSLIRATARGKRVTNAGVTRIEAFDAKFFRRAGDVRALHRALTALVANEDPQ